MSKGLWIALVVMIIAIGLGIFYMGFAQPY